MGSGNLSEGQLNQVLVGREGCFVGEPVAKVSPKARDKVTFSGGCRESLSPKCRWNAQNW